MASRPGGRGRRHRRGCAPAAGRRRSLGGLRGAAGRRALAGLLALAALGASGTASPGAAQDTLPRVVILTTGGTIASAPGGTLAGDSLVAAVPELLEHARVRVEELYRIGSSRMTPGHWLTLARRIDELLSGDPGLAGIVVTHGTDTLEETAFFLNLTVHHRRPVVLVGSMRPADAISADGPANLLNAVRVAVSPGAPGQGVLVVLDEDISAARDVWKTHNQRVGTFQAPELGVLGWVDPDTVLFQRATLRPHTTDSPFRVEGREALPEVALVPDYTGSDGSVLRELARRPAATRPDGIVVATFAGGRMSAGTRQAVGEAVEAGVPVVLASRVPGGRIVGNPAAPVGAVVAPDLPPHKARILLMLALTRTQDRTGLQELFLRF